MLQHSNQIHLLPDCPETITIFNFFQQFVKPKIKQLLISDKQKEVIELSDTLLISVAFVKIWKLSGADTLWMQKKVSVTGAGRLRECKNTEFVWELRKMRFL